MQRKEEYFQKLYEDTYDELLRYVSKLYWYDAAMVEDILQETYLILYRKIKEVMKHENPVGWVKTTAKFVTYRALDKNHAVKEILSQNQIDIAANPDELLDEYDDIRQFLSEKELLLIRKYYEDGYSLEELSKVYGISKSALKMRIHRVVKKIKRGIVVCLIFS